MNTNELTLDGYLGLELAARMSASAVSAFRTPQIAGRRASSTSGRRTAIGRTLRITNTPSRTFFGSANYG